MVAFCRPMDNKSIGAWTSHVPERLRRVARKLPPSFLYRMARRNLQLMLAYRAMRMAKRVPLLERWT